MRSAAVPQSLQSHACTKSQRSITGCRLLTVIENEVSQAYSIGVIALEGGSVQVQQRSGSWIQGNLCHLRALPAYCGLKSLLCCRYPGTGLAPIKLRRGSACRCSAVAVYPGACRHPALHDLAYDLRSDACVFGSYRGRYVSDSQMQVMTRVKGLQMQTPALALLTVALNVYALLIYSGTECRSALSCISSLVTYAFALSYEAWCSPEA